MPRSSQLQFVRGQGGDTNGQSMALVVSEQEYDVEETGLYISCKSKFKHGQCWMEALCKWAYYLGGWKASQLGDACHGIQSRNVFACTIDLKCLACLLVMRDHRKSKVPLGR